MEFNNVPESFGRWGSRFSINKIKDIDDHVIDSLMVWLIEMARDIYLCVTGFDGLKVGLKSVNDPVHRLAHILQVAPPTLNTIYEVATFAGDILLASVAAFSEMAGNSTTMVYQGAICAIFSGAFIACFTVG